MSTTPYARWLFVFAVLAAQMVACRRDDADKPAPVRKGRDAEWITVAQPKQRAEPAAAAERDADVTSPAGQPDAAAPAPPQETAMSPLADAAVGEWARYRTQDGWSQQYQVIADEAGRVLVEVRVAADGRLLGLPMVRREPPTLDWALDRAAARNAAVVARPERLRSAGRDWDCRLSVATWTRDDDTFEQRVWMSEAAPVYGLVRMELTCTTTGDRVASLELVAFDAAATP